MLTGKLQLYRGTHADLAGADASAEGMLAYTTDTQQVFVATGTTFVLSGSGGPTSGSSATPTFRNLLAADPILLWGRATPPLTHSLCPLALYRLV
jgi:hypothetical protein